MAVQAVLLLYPQSPQLTCCWSMGQACSVIAVIMITILDVIAVGPVIVIVDVMLQVAGGARLGAEQTLATHWRHAGAPGWPCAARH